MSNRPAIKLGKSVSEKLEEIKDQSPTLPEIQEPAINSEKKRKAEIIINENSSVLERLNASTIQYKRVGVDIKATTDDYIEDVTNGDLKDKASKKDVYNEILDLGLPLWKAKFNQLLKK